MTASGSENMLDVLASDHDSIFELLERLSGRDVALAVDDADEGLLQELVIEVVRHFVAEEQYLYPLVRAHLADGATLADAAFAAHRECEHDLKTLESSTAGDAEIEVTLSIVRRQLTEHVQRQQAELFPAVVGAVPAAQLVELADQVLGAEQVAPTRPRTVATANPTLSKFASVVEGFIDHVRDTYSNRGESERDIS